MSWLNDSVHPNKICIDYKEKWPFMVIFLYNLYSLGIHFKLCYIQNDIIMNSVIKSFVCIKSDNNR